MVQIITASEHPKDYAAIADVNLRAFDNIGIPHLVALQRQRRNFYADLSLVAVIDGRVVGHVLFMPQRMRLMDAWYRVVNLSPIAIAPEFQRQGIGGALIEAGHERARENGYDISILLGHPTYYPRFGYRTHAYGASSCVVQRPDLPTDSSLETRAPMQDDIPALMQLWEASENAIDFTLPPNDTLLDWLSPNPAVQCRVYLQKGEIVGYTRALIHYTQVEPPRVFEFYATPEAAPEIAAALCGEHASIRLPVHPAAGYFSANAARFAATQTQTWEAGMAYALNEQGKAALDASFKALADGTRAAGRPYWGNSYDLVE